MVTMMAKYRVKDGKMEAVKKIVNDVFVKNAKDGLEISGVLYYYWSTAGTQADAYVCAQEAYDSAASLKKHLQQGGAVKEGRDKFQKLVNLESCVISGPQEELDKLKDEAAEYNAITRIIFAHI
ncbi:unnamed protein product [Vitrella brassicaformis CCMP3155]|uniref:ABM domain-containing protein n=1 Tax=Vitrella brassicaformis (strain CCMP3155) TaxID=1169540 RepID=A0A0G4EWF9_VITBC|nr:unnamed protein product [Vitrella brassicaformis CCMP3155]|eukprot:CEM02378.1 unnamed protein product [Vitrella brassicaformis CCMP3155]